MAAGVSMMEHSVTSYRLPDGRPPELGARPLFASGFVTRTSQVNNEITKRLSLAQSMEEAGLGDGYTFSSDPTDEEIDGLLEALNSHTSLVLGTYNGHVKPGMRKLFARLEPASQKMPMLAVSFALPYDLADMPAGVPGLAVWEYTEETVDLVAKFLRGELVPQGRMPVTM